MSVDFSFWEQVSLGSDEADSDTRIVLPEGYYLEHFRDFVRNITDTYLDFLTDRERTLILGFSELSLSEQQLFVRLSNRSKTIFFFSSLKYPEIEEPDQALASLFARGFLKRPAAGDLVCCLESLTKNQLLKLLAEITPAGSRQRHLRSLRKEELLSELRTGLEFEQFKGASLYNDIIVREFVDELRYLYFLAFGNVRSDLKLYALRDLGIRRSNPRPNLFGRRFETADEARSEYFYRCLREELRELSAEDVVLKLGALTLPDPVGQGAIRVRDKFVLEAAQSFLRVKKFEPALALLSLGSGEQIVEKRIRLLHSLGRREAVNAEIDKIFQNPASAGLLFFAEEFTATTLGRIRRSAVTTALKESVIIQLSARYRGRPEQGVIDHLAKHGSRAFHTENRLWVTLFGILFWDELFEGSDSALFSEFDLMPKDLLYGTFYERKQEEIQNKLAALHSYEQSAAIIHAVWDSHHGTPNGIFSWSYIERELLLEFLRSCFTANTDFPAVMVHLARDFDAWRRGFPDLLVLKDGKPSFVEVKSLGDKLHAAQLRQLRLLSDCGFETKIIRAEWEYEPHQTYVVVDVETTGGIPSKNRVIEVGAVKFKNGEIIDRFSTLVHPGCRIPGIITGITGITNDAVAAAPRFAEIASALSEFIADALFVGHNARFDHAFISEEFQRAGLRFRAPLFCTVQGMRAAYPGLDSYALDALCREFSIPLTSHHRALCDAEATTHLLRLLLQRELERTH